MEYPERIQRSLDYIEAHLNEPLLFDEIAKQAFLSVPHLYKIFPYMTGCTVGQYIRKRRLTSSVNELLDTGKRVIDIAFDFQFESQESYIRAFKAMFGITPGEHRKSKGILALYNPMRLNLLQKKGELLMQPDIITKKYLMAGVETVIDVRNDFSEIMENLRAKLVRNLDKTGNKLSPMRMIGIWQPFDNSGKEENMTKRIYFTGVEISDTGKIPGELTVKELPQSIYAVFREKSRGTMSRYMYTEWLPTSGYILNEDLMCDIEIFDTPELCKDTDECDILLPICVHTDA